MESSEGDFYDITLENVTITVIDNGRRNFFAPCKLDYIELGKR